MKIIEHIETLRAEGARLADLATRTGPDAPVPTCPEWRVRDLLLHTGQVHRWAREYVATGRREPLTEAETLAVRGPEPTDAELVDWFREGHALLVAALEQAPDDLDCWSFLPAPSPLAFWARRQAHETAVHRVDAAAAAGDPEPAALSAAFAADGIEELLFGMLARPKYPLRTATPQTLLVRPTDLAESWLVTLSQDTLVATRGAAGVEADCAVSAEAGELYLFLWNRLPLERIAVSGDRSLLDLWREAATVRW